jgi:hypothetical protein
MLETRYFVEDRISGARLCDCLADDTTIKQLLERFTTNASVYLYSIDENQQLVNNSLAGQTNSIGAIWINENYR